MSRVGKLPITIPSGVDVSVEGNHIKVKGPKGELEREITPVLSVVTEEGQLRVERPDEEKRSRELHGLTRTLINLGYSHPIEIEPPEGITFAVETPNKVAVTGIDKELVGRIAAQVRSTRKPEPYKGKGVRYEGEVVRRKAGKAGKIGGG
jgi:large subunit ribosomal protein L6